MEIRTLTITDYKDIIKLWVDAGLEHKPLGRDTREHMAKEMETEPQLFLGCYSDNRLIGSVIGTFDGRKGWINRLCVHPEKRHSGIGRKLITEIESRLRQKGARIIAVMVYDENSSSLEVFKDAGYLVFQGVSYLTKREDEDV